MQRNQDLQKSTEHHIKCLKLYFARPETRDGLTDTQATKTKTTEELRTYRTKSCSTSTSATLFSSLDYLWTCYVYLPYSPPHRPIRKRNSSLRESNQLPPFALLSSYILKCTFIHVNSARPLSSKLFSFHPCKNAPIRYRPCIVLSRRAK